MFLDTFRLDLDLFVADNLTRLKYRRIVFEL